MSGPPGDPLSPVAPAGRADPADPAGEGDSADQAGSADPRLAGLTGSTVVVTGAAGGFGRAVSRALAQAGARVVLTGRDPDALDRAAAGLGVPADRVLAVPGDLTDPAAMDRVAAAALRRFGRVDALVNNAAVFGPLGPTWTLDERSWWHAMEVNLRGVLRGCRAVLPHMTAHRAGRIVNVVSSAGRTRWPLASAYSVSKAAVITLTENLAVELRRHAVSVFAYHPGLLDVGMAEDPHRFAERHGPAARAIAAWLRDQADSGGLTPLRTAVTTLALLLTGAADPLSGQYLTARDALAALACSRKADAR
ncbi:SDR family oxidoreductase [Actinokineospora iranica]|uniref:NADP-dependent 3-hydroxy acid dehydrogenase YdfG n=1 Tax=Actinokineospora iranica TaxID=1271860 RepID=A0A1G6VVH1_9PSEU|nr:SDR family oxidoreductase [Actinokineospora iranica]SDD57514.1 NADP-dependent 3-hydroxy acid dehydrogenase YdfG [Actinokineospora iranica]